MFRLGFDDDWTVLVGELDPPVARNTAKTATAGLAADLTLEEGGRLPIPESLVAAIGEEMLQQALDGMKTLPGDWIPIRLPDDWTTRAAPLPPSTPPVRSAKAAIDPQVRGGYLPTGVAWYRKVFDVLEEWDGQRVRLDFDGVMRDAHVWINGSFIGSHYSGYTGFSLDVTEFLRYGGEGRNVVLVRTDTSSTEGWWAEGGGMYRHVWLVVTNPVHVARHGVFVATTSLDDDGAVLEIQTEIDNESTTDVEFTVEQVITTPIGEAIRMPPERATVTALQRATITQHVAIEQPVTWRLDAPSLHELATQIWVGEETVDTVDTTFGIRIVEYGPDGLRLNGELTPIRGACCHQDFAGVGIALPDRVHEYKIERLREMGCNAYRTAHHPPAPELLEACDRLGVLVLDENRRLESNAEGLADLAELIRRDRNHPSVFMWSLANEELIEGTPMSRRLLRRLDDVVHRLDPTRPTTAASAFGKGEPAYLSIPDVAGINYDGGDAARYRDSVPGAPVIATEDSSYMSTRGVYEDDPARGLTSSYDDGGVLDRAAVTGGVVLDVGTLGGALGTQASRLASTEANRLAHPYLGGVFVWTGFDYRGECAPFGWPAVNSPYGFMDLCGFPKEVYYYWRSRWNERPVIDVFPHWNWEGLEGQLLRVVTYTNCDEIELLVNDRRVVTEKVSATGIVTAAVTFEPGRIEARGYRDGMVVAAVVRETTGVAAALRLSTDDRQCLAGGRDVVITRVDVVDADARVVPDACPNLEFTCDGGAVVLGTGNGSPADHIPAVESRRPAFHGHALALVRAPEQPGFFTLTVSGDGVRPASIRFEAIAPS